MEPHEFHSQPPSNSNQQDAHVSAEIKNELNTHPNAYRRNPYFELREAEEIGKKGAADAREVLTFQIREKCRAEIDEYVDCAVDRFWTIGYCKPFAEAAQRCVRKYHNPEYFVNKERQIMQEREDSKRGILRLQERSQYNRFIEHSGNDWIPPSS